LDDSVVGTGFFVEVVGRYKTHKYLVTAKHVLYGKDDRDQKEERLLWARVRNVGDEAVRHVALNGEWLFGEDKDGHAIDAAAMVLVDDPSLGTGVLVPACFVTDEVTEKYIIGHGDELSIVGLFSPRPGEKTLLPVVRSGSIAAEPIEPVELNGRLHRAYLVEMRSWGGLSGSPVFVNLGYNREREGEINYQGRLWLFGVLSGHLGLDEYDRIQNPILEHYDPNELNMGIAMVTPWRDVMTILERDKSRIQAQEANHPSRKLMHADSMPDKGTETEAFTQADFERALRKASRPVKPKKKPR
jgi:hypothetical protein